MVSNPDFDCSLYHSAQLPRALWRTKNGFQRENQRIDALMKRFDKKSISCIVIDETNPQNSQSKGRWFKVENKRVASGR